MFADWTDRIAAGEVPPAPPRPEGIERNLVLTLWEWGGPATFAHDELSTDKRNPTANANGPIYGVDWGNDGFLTLDPAEHTATEVRIPVLDPTVPPGKPQSMPKPSPYWGSEPSTGSILPSRTMLRWTAKAASGCRRDSGVRRISRLFARIIRRRSWLRGRRASGRCSTTTRNQPVPSGRHLFRHSPRAVRNDKDETLYGTAFSAARSVG